MLGVAIALQKRGVRDAWRDTLRSPLWLVGVLVEVLGDVCYLGAASAEGARISVMQPIVVMHFLVAMVAGIATLRERFSRREWLAASVLVAGGALVLGAAFTSRPTLDGTFDRPIVIGLSAGIAFGGALLGTLARKARAREVWVAIASGLSLSCAVVTTRVAGSDWRAFDGNVAQFFVSSPAPLLVVAASLGGFVLMQLALRAGRAALVSPVVALTTLVVPLPIAVALFGEALLATTAIGSVLVAVALGLLVAAAPPAAT